MNFTPTDEESMTYLTIANITLLTSLYTNGFLNSDYYRNMRWRQSLENVSIIKNILEQRGLDNPSMMLMQMYGLFVLPKELLGAEYEGLCKNGFDTLIIQKQKGVQTTYQNEDSNNLQSINFYRHIRNAISHARYDYYTLDGAAYVRFKDSSSNNTQQFSVDILTEDISDLCDYLCNTLMEFVNNRILRRQTNCQEN